MPEGEGEGDDGDAGAEEMTPEQIEAEEARLANLGDFNYPKLIKLMDSLTEGFKNN